MGLPTTERITAKTLLEIDPPTDDRLRIVPTRWPFTYAYDYMRSHAEHVPEEAISRYRAQELLHDEPHPVSKRHIPSRAQAAGVAKFWVAMLGDVQDRYDLLEQLAVAFLIENHFVLPELGEELHVEISEAMIKGGIRDDQYA